MNSIEQLVSLFEQGKISRRELVVKVGVLVVGLAGAGQLAEAADANPWIPDRDTDTAPERIGHERRSGIVGYLKVCDVNDSIHAPPHLWNR